MFHMTNSGLPNVWLQSGFETGEDKFGPYYSIEDLPGLYRAIALSLAHGAGELSADELRVIRRQLELTQAQLAAKLGRTDQAVLLWERRGKIPADAAQQIKLLVLRRFSPRMAIEDAFRHLEQPKPARIVLARRDGQWECALATSDPVLVAKRTTSWHENAALTIDESVRSFLVPEEYSMAVGFPIERIEEQTWKLQ